MTVHFARDGRGLVAILHSTVLVREEPHELTVNLNGYRTASTLRALRLVGACATEIPFTIHPEPGEKWWIERQGKRTLLSRHSTAIPTIPTHGLASATLSHPQHSETAQ